MCSDASTRAFVGLGANLGDRRATIEAALSRLAAQPGISLVRRTALVETPPWGVEDQPPFLNAVAELRTTLEPLALLESLQRLERELGRRPTRRWGPREIDLDILLFGDRVVDAPTLVVPHPHLTDRPFVLSQLLALDPSLVHPRSGQRLSSFQSKTELLAR
ncbi:MAG: 2-amino-4-hydroxy-6-hydroxymethyldihydropteridine diphosphokinase [Proteobacteria bacterium]|jgi:2-amino-4-hydroxy-6-hydroxymethyldihydropteridine diphosphokinase|nr:2-amino-4-hydroxy-6-hydroxymethyldihydropteridine diphosphokinase [Pseudomonadota bacterium]